MPYRKEQRLNDWVTMLHAIYGLSQNYARTEFEILAHLSEVTGAFGKFLFKLKQPDRAKEFLPKMFGWAVALAKKVNGERANLEDILLTKYPCVCPYCISAPCKCVSGQKQPIDGEKVRAAYYREPPAQGRSLNDFQVMFRKIYEQSWGLQNLKPGSPEAIAALQKIFTRLIEEISEVGESVRFAHLYPSNFDNELADYIAWIFALVSSIDKASAAGGGPVLIEELLWPAYPGICMVCMLDICDCRPSPVRELLSKPSLRDLQFVDGLTHASNKAKFENDLNSVGDGTLPLPVPISCIHIDLDNFRNFNSAPFDHGVGDAALKHLFTVVRQKIRNRDRLYRVGGDEFAVMCPDLSAAEAQGMIARVASALKERLVPSLGSDGSKPPFITLSVGITECRKLGHIRESFVEADKAAIGSKTLGKDRITLVNRG
ncbi:MAG TPA: GGDEF domain-containing protein [Candidatus Acidoferrum sp.]|nr:GGDEF domain-containing protein [Candidatus Acidoferrum sp.]